MKKSGILLALVLLTSLFTTKAHATTYYVSTTDGDESCTGLASTTPYDGSGTGEACPWKTLAGKASTYASFNAGDSILFERGETFTGFLTIKRSGSDGLPMIYGAYGEGAKPIFNGAGNNHTIRVDTKNYINISDLILQGGVVDQIYLTNSSSNINISNVDTAGGNTAGIYLLTGNFSNISVSDSNILDQTGLTGAGINMSGTSFSDFTFDNVVASSSKGSGMKVAVGTASDFTITDSTFNGHTNSSGSDGKGLVFAGGGIAGLTMSNTTIKYNTNYGVDISGTVNTNISIDDLDSQYNGLGLIIEPTASSTNVDIINSTISNNSHASFGQGIYLQGKLADLNIATTTISNNSSDGIYLAATTTNAVLNNLTVSTNGANGVYVYGDTNSLSLRNITASNNVTGSGINFNALDYKTINGVTIDSSILTTNGVDGIHFGNNGSNATTTNVTAANNLNDGFGVANTWSNVVFDRCTADTNGVNGEESDGDGFSFHDSSTGTIKNSVAKNNLKTAVTNISTSAVNIFNNLFYHETNGTQALLTFTDTGTQNLYNNTIYSADQFNVGVDFATGVISSFKNNIVSGFDVGVNAEEINNIIEDYNIVYGASTGNFNNLTPGTNTSQVDPRLNNPITDFTLNYLSTAIDAGTDVSATRGSTDLAGNPIYGTPDIGAYEYQPPYTMTTDNLETGGNIRIYEDGQYRYTTATTSTATINLSVTPAEGTFAAHQTFATTATRPEWLNISAITWTDSLKQWTASSSVATTTIFTIGDLTPNTSYDIAIDNVTTTSQIANSEGEITYTYTGPWSTHTFSITPTPIPVVTTTISGSRRSAPAKTVSSNPVPSLTTPKLPSEGGPSPLTPSPYNLTPVFTTPLYFGLTNSNVKLLQQFLNTHGFTIATIGAGAPGHETNYFGKLTKLALAKFQLENGLIKSLAEPVAGYLGPKTRALIGGMK